MTSYTFDVVRSELPTLEVRLELRTPVTYLWMLVKAQDLEPSFVWAWVLVILCRTDCQSCGRTLLRYVVVDIGTWNIIRIDFPTEAVLLWRIVWELCQSRERMCLLLGPGMS